MKYWCVNKLYSQHLEVRTCLYQMTKIKKPFHNFIRNTLLLMSYEFLKDDDDDNII